MKIRRVASASWSAAGDSMGTLFDEGILTKEYVRNYPYEHRDIVWTNVSEDVVVVNNHEIICPGHSVTWSK